MARPGIQKHLAIAPLLQCPICGHALHAREASVACENGHDFAISAKGFLNLCPQQAPHKGYDEAFFSSRQSVMEHGYYNVVSEGIIDALRELPRNAVILDAGCGEGSYAKALCAAMGCTVIGFDIAREGIRCAARGGGPVRWLVADLAHIPVRPAQADVILNVFTPANYAEFQRVLKPGGMLVKVIPAPQHMHELRELAGSQLRKTEFTDHGVAEHLERHMRIVQRTRVTRTSPVTPEDAVDLARMSPVSFGVNLDTLDLAALSHITVDAEIICATF
ncbi:methyltransferase domain-containing protein [Collinsella provencensis]|uniref:methyltransferase domain-containing protein n=1 Tax=Collinsella provencensis TaxID=1937461 RepID=UPI000C81AA09|nr:methyltransferase domain-containing protein [Collinsella provencensis]